MKVLRSRREFLYTAAAFGAASRSNAETPDPWSEAPKILSRINAPKFPARDFDVTKYGAREAGHKDCTKAIAKAVAACNGSGDFRTVQAAVGAARPGSCIAARQYFADCYIEGNVDFIFGDGKAYFDRCEIHSTAHNSGYVSAQGKHYAREDSGFVFRDCTLTPEPGVSGVFPGRPWRAYGTVIFLDSTMGAHIAPRGWREWHPGETNYLATVDYVEYDSKGPGAARESRDPHTHFLNAAEAKEYEPARFLAGRDAWNPEKLP